MVSHGYNARFDSMSAAQKSYVSEHQTIVFSTYDRKASPPKRVPDRERTDARRQLCESFYRFVVRCHNAGLIDERALLQECARHDISVDKKDLKRGGG